MENKILDMVAEKGESLKLMWVPAHTGIEGNEAVDEAAKDALNEGILPGTKATEMDWKRWLKIVARRILENKWMISENAMVQIKPNMKKYKGTRNLSRHDQVVVSRLRMGYTRITQAYRLDNQSSRNVREHFQSPIFYTNATYYFLDIGLQTYFLFTVRVSNT
jgi:hypothetical protein